MALPILVGLAPQSRELGREGTRFGCVAYQVSLDATTGIKALILLRIMMF